MPFFNTKAIPSRAFFFMDNTAGFSLFELYKKSVFQSTVRPYFNQNSKRCFFIIYELFKAMQ